MYLVTQCSNYGGVADVDGTACCLGSCGTCDVIGCDTRPGGPDNCCLDNFQQPCGSGQDAPCLLPGKCLLLKCHCTVCNKGWGFRITNIGIHCYS